jgi:hypothetical protein
MMEEKEIREECLYCHGQINLGKPCLFCGDVKLAESRRSDPLPRPTSVFQQYKPNFEPKIAGV